MFQEYINRVGRTARGVGTSGQALLFLRREEIAFLAYLQRAKIRLNELEFSWDKGFEIQASVCTFFFTFDLFLD